MKIFVGTILTILLFAGTSCQRAVNVEKEKEAILAVLQEEGVAMLAKDKERVFALHVQDDLETRLELGEYGFNTYNGWDEVSGLLGDALSGDGALMGLNAVNRKENMIIKVTGNTAWLTCDNIWEWTNDGIEEGYSNIQVTFLEKIQGKWKISFAAYYSKPQPLNP
jgi:hypothetical protein